MGEFVVSARKYRPATFDTVVGQGVIVKTLKNAIEKGQLSHAYLFCGSRGVGKTTTARIFAKTINCLNPTADGEACGCCESCKAFDEGRSLNIHELDAASNNSVENIRSLIDQVRIPPQIGKYSVYIIDEAHMLSKDAFNAFLKTLEEPPSYAIFILATTEKQKIIATIISRCQVYDFTRISVDDIVAHLQGIAQKEGIEADADALNVIAVKSDGGMRDALSTFDQLVSFAGKKLTYADVIDNLNILDYDYFFRFVEIFQKTDVKPALLLYDEILSKGFEGQVFLSGLLAHLRDLLVAKDGSTAALLQVGAGIRQRYLAQSKTCETAYLCAMMEIVNETDVRYKGSRNKRLLVELMLIRLCQLADQKKNKLETAPFYPPLQSLGAQQDSNAVSKPTAEQGRASSAVQGSNSAQPQQAQAQPKPVRPAQNVHQAGTATTVRSNATASTAASNTKGQPSNAANPYVNTGTRSFSLNSLLKPTSQTQQQNTDAVELRDKAFTADDFSKAWFSFPKQIPDRLRLHHFFEVLPSEIQGENISIVTDNDMAAQELNALMPQLLTYLRNSLQNDKVMVKVKLVAAKTERHFYTDADKAKFMAEQNPEIKNLFSDLEMTFE